MFKEELINKLEQLPDETQILLEKKQEDGSMEYVEPRIKDGGKIDLSHVNDEKEDIHNLVYIVPLLKEDE